MKRSLLAVLSLLVFIGLCEAVVRLIGPDLRISTPSERLRLDQEVELDASLHIRDDVLGWRLTPGARANLRVEGGEPVPFSTNEAGFRGEAFDAYKDPKSYRVLVVGDSNAMGFGVADHATYAAQLEELLRTAIRMRGVDPEVINLGVEGYTSHQARLVLERYVAELDPDAVVIQVGFSDHCLAPMPDKERTFGRPALLNVLARSHAYRWLRRQLPTLNGAHEKTFRPVPRVSPQDFVANLAAMVETTRAAHALPVFITTEVRPSTPLVVNEVPLVVDADTTWVNQESVINEAFRRTGYESAGEAPPDVVHEVVSTLHEHHPTWPLPIYHLANWARSRGDSTAAAAYEAQWHSRDQERHAFNEYLRGARAAFPEGQLKWVDGGQLFDGIAKQEGWLNSAPLFIDFVHVGDRGHAALAVDLTRQIARHAAR